MWISDAIPGLVRQPVEDDIAHDPVRTAEDDGLRSGHVRNLVQQPAPKGSRTSAPHIPRVVVQFWDDPFRLPSDVRECLDSWRPLANAGFRRLLFDDDSASRFISRVFGRTFVAAFNRCHHPAMRCDYFRLCFLLARGGFYVDADERYLGASCEGLLVNNRLKMQPLCYSLATDSMVPTEVFVHERAFSPDWIFYVNNNPLVAPPHHPIIQLALARSTRILLNESGHPEVQSTTGPGNLTASLVRHSLACQFAGKNRDFELLDNWESISVSHWPLSYRDDARNWRLWDPGE
jgi:mannosyltransferase OCH1-like enzyme